MRQGEAFGLAEEGFDFEAAVVRVWRQVRRYRVFALSRPDMFHVLRHTCAGVQLEAGESIVSLSK